MLDDDDDWQDMPVVRSHDATALKAEDDEDERRQQHRYTRPVRLDASTSSNATGTHIEGATREGDWRQKQGMDERDYTRLELDDDPEEDVIHTRTQYLFDEEKDMTPLSQMQATKELLSGAQRIAYVGLCRLVTREMVQALKIGRHKELEAAAESMQNWATKIMGRLYHHMEVDTAEQRMIEQLAEHGVTAMDLVPSLATTHTVPNPEYDPNAVRESASPAASTSRLSLDEKDGDIGSELEGHEEAKEAPINEAEIPAPPPYRDYADQANVSPEISLRPDLSPTTPREETLPPLPASPPPDAEVETPRGENLIAPLPSTLPGVSTSLTAADETVTLDIRWTIICDLFLSLIADSVYDARSRVLLVGLADRLGLTEVDVVRFERRLTDALEISEGVNERENVHTIEGRKKKDLRRRYIMMGAATLGGGLVIGLSAGLLAPVIGAGLGAAFTTIGVTGTTGFLAGAGGAALITTGGVVTGANIAGRGMARRTKSVTTFRFLPLHNNKRVSCYITVPGFMNGANDDVRLPFSVLDPVIGDVFSVLWEPEMMGETGNALKILASEALTQVGQQVLQATVMTALMSALQWPILLTKLGYLIDNPWSNALDRAWAAGLLLADILMKRDIGVRPVSLIGFSLGARVIFYALLELAKNKAYGIVQDVYLMGATVTAPVKVWRSVRGAVSGRVVNAYARNDWVLAYLFRATSGGIGTVAGLRPVENVPDLENVDITDVLVGHMSYRTSLPVILKLMGFKTTRDTFDEPDEEDTPDREVLTPEEEARRAEAKENAKKKWWQKKTRSGTSTPNGGATPKVSATTMARGYSDDMDDLPPRMSAETTSKEVVEEPSSPVAKQAGFDMDALRQEIAGIAGARASTDSLPARLELPRVSAVKQRSASADFGAAPVFPSTPPPPARQMISPPITRTPSPASPVVEHPRIVEPKRTESPEEPHRPANMPSWEEYGQHSSSVISFAGDDGEITTFDASPSPTDPWRKPLPSQPSLGSEAWRNPW